eukprot:gb/GEZN01005581.1/.p1 GENE.gb/GEZN01005581.1/~~gb/GEZN01005581.1/.p1  ORF type:complete len:489 (-),score=102.28 gb/GEZN01005581.1/:270-1736(-)
MIHTFSESKKRVDDDDEEEEAPLYLTHFMERLVNNKARADVIFRVGDKSQEVYAHRLILAASSPIFQAMLYPPKNEAGVRPSVKLPLKITVKDVQPEFFINLLACIYTDEVDIEPENLPALIQLAKKYQVEKLQLLCTEYLEKDVSVENAVDLFQMAPDLLGEQEFALPFIRENMEEIVASDSFLRLSRDRLLALLKDDLLAVEEVSLFQAVVRWGQHQLKKEARKTGRSESKDDAGALKEVLEDLLKEVRFAVMETDDIATHVAPSGLVDEGVVLKYFQYSVLPDGEKEGFDFGDMSKKPRQGGFMVKDSKLLDAKLKKSLLKMFNGAKGIKLDLIYRGSRDGFTGSSFHLKCDGHGPTLTVIKPSHNNNIFGGYSEHEWSSSGSYSSQPAWLYALRTGAGDTAYKFLPTSSSSHAYNNSSYGPTFGGGHDLHVNSMMTSQNNYTNPSTFTQVAPGYSGHFTKELFAGMYKWAVGEIEVFSVKIKSK